MKHLPELNEHYWSDLLIEVVNEPTYTLNADNNFAYAKAFFGPEATDNPVSKHGVKLFRNGQLVSSCILIGSGGATCIHQTSSLVDAGQLLVSCCNTVFCLSLPELHLNWQVQADWATCFQILHYKDEYIVHGELQITRLTRQGDVKWTFEGADIFVTMDGQDSCVLEPGGIRLTDFSGAHYQIDYDGKPV